MHHWMRSEMTRRSIKWLAETNEADVWAASKRILDDRPLTLHYFVRSEMIRKFLKWLGETHGAKQFGCDTRVRHSVQKAQLTFIFTFPCSSVQRSQHPRVQLSGFDRLVRVLLSVCLFVFLSVSMFLGLSFFLSVWSFCLQFLVK